MPIDNRDWYRADRRARQQAERRRTHRTLWLTRAAIGGLLVIALGLAVPLLGNVAANMACSRGFSLIIIQTGGCPADSTHRRDTIFVGLSGDTGDRPRVASL